MNVCMYNKSNIFCILKTGLEYNCNTQQGNVYYYHYYIFNNIIRQERECFIKWASKAHTAVFYLLG